MTSRSQLLAAAAASILLPAAGISQVVNFSPPAGLTTANNFGAAIAISDVDGVGRRDVVVGAPGNGLTSGTTTGRVFIISGDGPSAPAAPTLIGAGPLVPPPGGGPLEVFGFAVTNLGNIDGQPGEEFAVSSPGYSNTVGRVYVYSLRTFGSTPVVLNLGFLTGPNTFGQSLALISLASGTQLAVGVPGVQQVHLFATSTLLSGPTIPPGLAPTRTLIRATGYAAGDRLGESLAAGPDSYLAVGAPSYTSSGTTSEGYIAVYNLATTSNTPVALMTTSVFGERIGRAIASVGYLSPPSPPNTSPRPDFAALGSSGKVVLFHTPQTLTTTGTWTQASVANLGSAIVQPLDGRMASLGDIDGDRIGDFAVVGAGSLRVFSTQNNGLSELVNQAAGPACALASGPDLRRIGGTELIAGPPFNSLPAGGSAVRVLPLATSTVLPNATALRLRTGPAAATARPRIGLPSSPFTLDLRASIQSGPAVLVALFFADAPQPFFDAPTPLFSGGTIFLGPTPSTIGPVGVVAPGADFVFPIQIPTDNSLLYAGAILQGVTIPATGPFVLSDGVFARLGGF